MMSYCLNPDCSKPQNPPGAKFCLTCGLKLLLGDRYRAIKPIGQGGFGRTFLAVDEYKPSQPRCVIKQFFPQAQGTNNSQKAAELFTREAVRLDDLGKHPQIPELLAHFEQDGRQYLVQEFIDGQNLSQELETNGVFSEIQIIQLLEDLLPVLLFVHSKKVIHRDIKPENIIRRSVGGQLVLVDFGAAGIAYNTTMGSMGTAIGSAGFAAPEQMAGKAFAASDLYALGVTCIYLMTHKSPFDLFDSDRGIWVWQNYLKRSVDRRLGSVLDKLLHAQISQRYQSASEVMKDLIEITSAANSRSTPQPPPKNASFQSSSNPQAAPTNSSTFAKILGGTPQVITGKIMQSLGNYDKAIASFDRALAINPDNFEAWYKKGRLCFELQRTEEALWCYEKTVELKPNHFEAWRSLGILYYTLKRYEESVLSYDRALQIYPTQAEIWLCRSVALKQFGNASEAHVSFEKAKQLLPNNSGEKAAILLQAWEVLIR